MGGGPAGGYPGCIMGDPAIGMPGPAELYRFAWTTLWLTATIETTNRQTSILRVTIPVLLKKNPGNQIVSTLFFKLRYHFSPK